MTKRAVLLEALASTPTDIERLAHSLDETTAAWRPELGGEVHRSMSCYDVLSHLCAMEPLFLTRLERIVTEDEPTVPALHALTLGLEDATIVAARSVEQFRQARMATLTFLQALSPAAWQRAAIHEHKGRLTLRFLVQDLVTHDIEHTHQLVEIQQARRAFLKRQAAAAPLSLGGAGQGTDRP